ncbi:MAG TPA: hypothetical protein DCE48_09720 [Lachnospiraceae bacterium]|uniref:hypothetical protein n=1 Tax=Anaerosporobacter sp. TaxID=1872529 RepID=UPI000EBB1017|nr:hypothetical protein [Anaerosporobacter sp.]HAB60960.1 hypothetical protein [Lachnospiraceae bacterium]
MNNQFNAANKDQAKAQKIRRQYMDREDNKFEQLQSLDSKVKTPGKIVSSVLGVVGALTMGAGMSLIMVWENMTSGLLLGIPGLIIALAAYPIYGIITGNRKKKYADQIMRLCEELTNN